MNWIDDLAPEFGTVTGQFVVVAHDSADGDLVPDVQPLNGTVLLTPTVTAGRINATVFAQIAPVPARIFGGQIVDDEDVPGIRILSNDTNIVDADWAWRATFQLDSGLRLRPLDFKLAAGETVHITGQTLPIEHTAYQIIQGEPGHTPEFDWAGTRLLIDGAAGPDLSGPAVVETASELLSSRLAFRTGDVTVGIASDSTADGTTDWVRLWEAHLAEMYPHLRIEHEQWRSASKDYGPTVVVQEGEGEPAFSGLVLRDTFTRADNLTTPDEGGAWTAYNPGSWVLDGSTARTTGIGYLRADAGGKDMTTETTLVLDTTTRASAQDLRIFQGSVQVQLTVSTAGMATAYVYTRTGGTNALVGSVALATLGIASGAANAGTLAVRVEGSIQNFTATLTGPSSSWTKDFQVGEQDYQDMPTTFQLFPYSATPGIGISEAQVNVADRPATYQTLRVLSGTMGGGTMQYQLDNWDQMFSRDLVSPGTPGTPPTQAPATATDAFTRTGVLAGSTTDTGEMWQGHASWSTDGTAARNAGQVGAAATLALPGLTGGRWTVALTTTAPSAEETVRLGVRTTGNSVYGVFLGIAVKTDGMVTINPYVRTATAGFRTLGALTGHGITAGSSTVQNVPMSISLDGTSVHAKAGGASADYQITSGELAELGDKLEMQSASATGTSWRVLDMSADYVKTIPGLPGTPPVYGDPLDVMIISHGHNYQDQTPGQYLTALDGFLGVMAVKRPSTLPLLVSQNPQFVPAAHPLPHARRQAAVRGYARRNGYGYAPVFEHFAAQPESGRAWVLLDGVHPNTPTTPTPTPGRGSSEWGRVLADATTT